MYSGRKVKGKNRIFYENKENTYNHSFQIAIFRNGILPCGQYSFPFSFLLPRQLVGSMYENQQCYIRYYLSCQLHPSENINQIQKFTRTLHINQSLRKQYGAIFRQDNFLPVCCYCKSYGKVKVSFTVDKNFVTSGQQVIVKIFIDNSQGQQSVGGIQIKFQQLRWKISSNNIQRTQLVSQSKLYTHPTTIEKGYKQQINANIKIPQNLVYSTAIGSILSRYNILNFVCNVGCCSLATNPYLNQLMIFHTKTPKSKFQQKLIPSVMESNQSQ